MKIDNGKLKMKRLSLCIMCMICLLAFSACGNKCMDTPISDTDIISASDESVDPAIEFEESDPSVINYIITEGIHIQESIVLDGKTYNFSFRLPKIIHAKNREIESWCDNYIQKQQRWLSQVKNGVSHVNEDGTGSGLRDFKADEIYNFKINKAHDVVSVIITPDSVLDGITFDNAGKTYSDDEVMALYGITRDQVEKFLRDLLHVLPDVDIIVPTGIVVDDEPFPKTFFVGDEHTLICLAKMQGGFWYAGYLHIEDGKITGLEISKDRFSGFYLE